MFTNPFKTTRDALIAAALILATLIAGGFAIYTAWQKAHTAKTEANLSKNQTGAATASGQDAVNTLGNRADAEAETDRVSRENTDSITKAKGADAKVAQPVNDAGVKALCRRAAYKDTLRCKAFAGK